MKRGIKTKFKARLKKKRVKPDGTTEIVYHENRSLNFVFRLLYEKIFT